MKKWVKNKAPEFFAANFFLKERTFPCLISDGFLFHMYPCYWEMPLFGSNYNSIVYQWRHYRVTLKKIKHRKPQIWGIFHLKVQNKTFLSSESVSEVMFFLKYNLIPTFCKKLECNWMKISCTIIFFRMVSAKCSSNLEPCLPLLCDVTRSPGNWRLHVPLASLTSR